MIRSDFRLFLRHFIIFLLLIQFAQCDQCTDCDLNISEQRVSFQFINADSLQAVGVLIETESLDLEVVNDSLDSLDQQLQISQDSLTALQIGIDSGNVDLTPLLEGLILGMQTDSLKLDLLTGQADVIDSTIAVLDGIKTTINSGLIQLERVTNLLDEQSLNFEDSTELYSLSLNINNSLSWYEFEIAGNNYELQLSHDNELELDARRNVVVNISSFMVVEHEFDSVGPASCFTEKCPIDGTVLVCYF